MSLDRCVTRKQWIVAIVWLVIGLACLASDEYTQPHFADWGANDSALRIVAEWWQRIAEFPGIVLFLTALLMIPCHSRLIMFKRLGAGLAATALSVQLIKYLIGRARPNDVADTTKFFGPFGMFNPDEWLSIDSMPSGHTAAAFSMATILAVRWPACRWCWYFVAVGVGFARTVVDRHFASDVVFGALLGTYVTMLAMHYVDRAQSGA